MLRRVWIKMPSARHTIVNLYQHYKSQDALGAACPEVDVDCLTPAPLPGGERLGDWKWASTPQGPISLLLENVHCMAATLHIPSFVLTAKFDHNINLLADPYHHVPQAIPILAARVVHAVFAPGRTVLQNCPAIDRQIYHEAVKPLTAEQRGVTFGIATLSIADQAYLHRVNPDVPETCIFCGKTVSSVDHIYWGCDHPKLQAARTNITDDPKQGPLELTIIENSGCLPLALRYGIPPPLALLPQSPALAHARAHANALVLARAYWRMSTLVLLICTSARCAW